MLQGKVNSAKRSTPCPLLIVEDPCFKGIILMHISLFWWFARVQWNCIKSLQGFRDGVAGIPFVQNPLNVIWSELNMMGTTLWALSWSLLLYIRKKRRKASKISKNCVLTISPGWRYEPFQCCGQLDWFLRWKKKKIPPKLSSCNLSIFYYSESKVARTKFSVDSLGYVSATLSTSPKRFFTHFQEK
jgi:hypothetical protein